MLSTERSEFDDHLGTLCAGFNVPVTDLRAEAYWRGLAKMHLGQFARVVEQALGPDGPERIPTVPQCWSLWRTLRAQRPKAPVTAETTHVPFDGYHTFGQRCLLRFLSATGGVSESALPSLVAEKNRLVEQFREVASEIEVTPEEVRETLFAAFARLTGQRVTA